MVSEGREACTMLITNWSSRSRNSRFQLLGPNAVFMKDFKAPPWALCSELSLAFDNIKNFYNMTDFDVKILPDNWKIYIKTFISSLLTLLRVEELQRTVSL